MLIKRYHDLISKVGPNPIINLQEQLPFFNRSFGAAPFG